MIRPGAAGIFLLLRSAESFLFKMIFAATMVYMMGIGTAPLIADQACATRTRYCWTVSNRGDDEFLGIIGMTAAADRFRSGEIYYKLLPAH